MKKINNYWVDENNNKWSCSLYTEEQAIKNCSSCIDCHDCMDCYGCHGCRDCSGCHGCHGCSDYTHNPNRYAQKGLGANWNNTCIYWDKEQTNIQVVCGCFRGSIEEFKKAVINKYSKNHDYIKYANIALKIMEFEKGEIKNA